MIDEKRRKICQAGGLLVAGAVLPGCLNKAPGGNNGNGDGGADATVLTAGKITDLVIGDIIEVREPGHNVDVLRDEQGIYTVDANCTHARCILVFQSRMDGFLCTCHGSTFDYNGQNPTPPAPTPLDHYKTLLAADGTITVDTSQKVDPSTRTKV